MIVRLFFGPMPEQIANGFFIFFFIDAVNQDELDMFNEVIPDEEVKDSQNEQIEDANQIREQHRELKDMYDNLERKTAQGRGSREFVEPKVISLWNAALESNFTAPQLAALKVKN